MGTFQRTRGRGMASRYWFGAKRTVQGREALCPPRCARPGADAGDRSQRLHAAVAAPHVGGVKGQLPAHQLPYDFVLDLRKPLHQSITIRRTWWHICSRFGTAGGWRAASEPATEILCQTSQQEGCTRDRLQKSTQCGMHSNMQLAHLPAGRLVCVRPCIDVVFDNFTQRNAAARPVCVTCCDPVWLLRSVASWPSRTWRHELTRPS